MLKGLPFICVLILLPFHFILPASGMLLACTPPRLPHYHSACMFSKEQELIFCGLASSPPPSPIISQAITQLGLWELDLPLPLLSSLHLRYHEPNLVKGKSHSCT